MGLTEFDIVTSTDMVHSLQCYLCEWNSLDGPETACVNPFDPTKSDILIINCPNTWNCSVSNTHNPYSISVHTRWNQFLTIVVLNLSIIYQTFCHFISLNDDNDSALAFQAQ